MGLEDEIRAAEQRRREARALQATEAEADARALQKHEELLHETELLLVEAAHILTERRARGQRRGAWGLTLGNDSYSLTKEGILLRHASRGAYNAVRGETAPRVERRAGTRRVTAGGMVHFSDDGSPMITGYTGSHRNTENFSVPLKQWLADEIVRLTA